MSITRGSEPQLKTHSENPVTLQIPFGFRGFMLPLGGQRCPLMWIMEAIHRNMIAITVRLAIGSHAKACVSVAASDCSSAPDHYYDGRNGLSKLKDVPTFVATAEFAVPVEFTILTP